ncbi:hypothetical protein WR25_02248 [Diploscapter pachys]|uniref:Uncharacterized protein n=1 Tax=Diploscapter pachys TaxID=2018661 RepID=A0A2A2LEW0_9BILA|nr:hypothetical protein WR25_02248 [Diploscapter pachys]
MKLLLIEVLLFCVMNLLNVLAITREELIDQLKYEQDAANTFERRIHRRVKPVAWIAGEPVWPRVLEKVKSEAELFLDDDNFAYRIKTRDPVELVRKMDQERNYQRVLELLNRYTN